MLPGNNSEERLPTTPNMASLPGDMVLPPVVQVRIGEAGYPARLAGLAPRAASLWCIGRMPRPQVPCVAIVGSRAASGAGCEKARRWSEALAGRGFAIVSGGAFGIDAAAHEGALAAGGETFAVLGCGVDVVYPDRHAGLFARIAQQGGLVSELPPGTAPRARQFPARNRIIAALADAVLVVEAAVRSGGLITAGHARKRGQRVLAAPGTPGTDGLLARGALPVTSVATLWDALEGRAAEIPAAPLPGPHAALVTALREGADSPGSLARRLGISLPSIMALLTEAELAGWVRRAGGSQDEVLRGH
jgi:DNA processing protein